MSKTKVKKLKVIDDPRDNIKAWRDSVIKSNPMIGETHQELMHPTEYQAREHDDGQYSLAVIQVITFTPNDIVERMKAESKERQKQAVKS